MNKAWLVILCLFFGQSANAESYLFVGSHFPILSEELSDGTYTGIAIDLAMMIGTRLGHTIVVRLYPWERAKFMVKNGIADVLMAPYKNAEREAWLSYSKTHFFIDEVFFYVRPENPIGWDGSYASLQQRSIGIVQGWSVDAEFDAAKSSLSIDYAPTLDICFRKLLAGRVDMIPASVREARAALARLELGKSEKPVIIQPALARNYNYFGFSRQKDLSGFKNGFDQELMQIKASGVLSTLLKEKYGLSDEEIPSMAIPWRQPGNVP